MEKEPEPDPHVLRVARYLSAAFVASEHGAGMDYTRKKYADEPIGLFWIQMAELAIAASKMSHDRAFHTVPPGRPIQ
jgi:hypothetical protein